MFAGGHHDPAAVCDGESQVKQRARMKRVSERAYHHWQPSPPKIIFHVNPLRITADGAELNYTITPDRNGWSGLHVYIPTPWKTRGPWYFFAMVKSSEAGTHVAHGVMR